MMTNYHFTESGLDWVYLSKDMVVQHDTPYGPAVSIPQLDAILDAIGHKIISRQDPICGQEVKFLRTRLSLSQEEFGIIARASRVTIARWEGERHGPIPRAKDALLRFAFPFLAKASPSQRAELLAGISEIRNVREQSERSVAIFAFDNGHVSELHAA
jgi:DNA-binding transcriptional regulator YiaG